MRPYWPKLASLVQKTCTFDSFQIFGVKKGTFHMKFMKRACGEFHKFHMKLPRV